MLLAGVLVPSEHSEFDWNTLNQMKISGTKGVATSFKPEAGSAKFSAPYVSLYPNIGKVTAKYLIANYTDQSDQFQLICFLEYQIIPCHFEGNTLSNRSEQINVPSGEVRIVKIQFETETHTPQDFVIVGVSLSGKLSNLSYRAVLNPEKRKIALTQKFKVDYSREYAESVNDMGISHNPAGLYEHNRTQDKKSKEVDRYFLIANKDEGKRVFLFSVCINKGQSASIPEAGFLEIAQNRQNVIALKAKPSIDCDEIQYGTVTNPYHMLEKEGTVLEDLSADYSDRYPVAHYYSLH